MPLAMSKAVFDSASPLLQQPSHLVDDVRSVLRVEIVQPVFGISRLLWRESDYRANVLTDEGAGITTRGLGGVDDGRTSSQHLPNTSICRRENRLVRTTDFSTIVISMNILATGNRYSPLVMEYLYQSTLRRARMPIR